jgi:photosystem II stability/assembly factor-like uncharacterized protein
MKFNIAVFFYCLLSLQGPAQQINILFSGNKVSLRGLSVVSDKIVWVSGNNGTIGKSVDAGKSWEWYKIKGFEQTDFRDIEGFNAKTAIIMGISEPGFILKTTDGGKNWKVVFSDSSKGIFLDAMEFWNEQSGIAIGDPIGGKFFIIRSFDGGDNWQKIPYDKLPSADSGEACFASSGTNIRRLDRQEACFVSGGLRSRLFIRDKKIDLPIIQGAESTGANSIAVRDYKKLKNGEYLVVVGGDFKNDTSREKNACYTRDGGRTWNFPESPPHGYRSCVEYISKERLITCGISGVDISEDGGKNWQLISGEGFHVCRKAKKGKTVFLAGANGKIANLIW